MTEQEWLASEDPAAMLSWAKSPNVDTPNKVAQCEANRRLSDRKLRLWVEACRHAAGGSDYFDIYNAGLRLAVEYWCGEDGRPLSRADRAALLRDIAGNPWRPVTLPVEPVWSNVWGAGVHYPWLTPTVLSLAHAAYDERAGRECKKCRGRGELSCPRCSGEGCSVYGVAANGPCTAGDKCQDCGGTGRIDSGTLDPARLAVLADALEEAGCDDEDLLRHLRGEEYTLDRMHLAHVATFGPDGRVLDRGPRRVKRWRPLSGPHVRGCWALSLILGQD